ncbi:hypothetical protein LLG46_08810 [bacterium]|nr:hypothetical protein [bacterium]
MIKKLILIVFLMLIAFPASCDGTNTLIAWPGWIVSSTEDLYMGHKHTSFPLTNMFDGDVSTAWVFSGNGKRIDGSPSGYEIKLTRDEDVKPVTVDSIWIMNGYNKSQELFLRNNRITKLNVFINGKYIKTVKLADSMGWHKISIPGKPVTEVRLVFNGFAIGRDNDICISEIALYNQDKKINMNMPKLVEFTEGDGDCGCGQMFYVIDHKGKRLKSYDMESPCVWSPSGRYIACVELCKNRKLWVMDTSTEKVIVRQTIPGDNWSWSEIDHWKDEHTLVFTLVKQLPGKTKDGDYKYEYYKKTIKIPNQ